MFERLKTANYWRNMVFGRHHDRKPAFTVLGWEVFPLDGKAYLFKNGRARRADWFDFCSLVRRFQLKSSA